MQPFDNVLGQKGFLEQSIANSSSSLIAQRGIHGLCFGLKRMNDDEDDDDVDDVDDVDDDDQG